MTVSATTNEVRYEGNGVTDTFAFNGRIFSTSDLVVNIITRATDALVETLTISTHYTVTIINDNSASVEVTDVLKIPTALQDIQIKSALQQTQSTDFPRGGALPSDALENSLDKLTVLMQQRESDLGRCVKLQSTETATTGNTQLPLPTARAGKYLAFDGYGDITYLDGTTSPADGVTETGTQTLTNKTIALGGNTISGTIAQFNTALTDAEFATHGGYENLTNKTITSPTISGAVNHTATATSGYAWTVTGNSITSGGVFSLASTSTAGSGSGNSYVININRSGANANASHVAYGVVSAVSNTGTTSTNVAGYFSASGATNNYALVVPSGGGAVLVDTNTAYSDGSIGKPPLQTIATTGAQAGMVVKVASGSSSTAMIGFVNSNGTVGSITTNGTATAYVTSSDGRLKSKVSPLLGGLDKISAIAPVTFIWKTTGLDGVGFVAQDLHKHVPEAVLVGDSNANLDAKHPDYRQWGVDMSKIVPYLVAAIQELSAKVAKLEKGV